MGKSTPQFLEGRNPKFNFIWEPDLADFRIIMFLFDIWSSLLKIEISLITIIEKYDE